jgi:thiamine biosynthesis lipoprotein
VRSPIAGALSLQEPDDAAVDWVSASEAQMGGRVSVHLRPTTQQSSETAVRAARQTLARIGAWASRLTRFDPSSELSRLNAASGNRVAVGPTLTAVLDWGRGAEAISDGIVDIGLLDARLAAEAGGESDGPLPRANRRWSLWRHDRGATVERPTGLRFDLDGVAKGWLADRALELLPGTSAVVDADGDIAVRIADDEGWSISVADPREPGAALAIVRLTRGADAVAQFGIATSGTTIHRWSRSGAVSHHLIDPRTGRPARTDILQATVIARTARAAEAFAKTAVILGTEAAAVRLDRPEVLGQILLTERDGALVSPATLAFVA